MYRPIIMGKDFAHICSNGICGQIHSVFDRAMNIEISGRQPEASLMTLLCADADVMPAALVTSMRGESWRKFGKTGDRVIFTPDIIYMDSIPFICGISSASVWTQADPVCLAHLPRLAYKEITARCGQVDLYLRGRKKDNTVCPHMRLPDLDAEKLLGYGDGLTPSGDDFLAGMLSAIHFAQKIYGQMCIYLPSVTEAVLRGMERRTNRISRHFLRYAAEGAWGLATERFMLALFRDEEVALRSAIEKKISYGASSGVDEMKGIMFGLCETIRLFEEG